MSHFTTIETQIRDIQALMEACRELGLTVREKTLARGYSSNTLQGDLVMALPATIPAWR